MGGVHNHRMAESALLAPVVVGIAPTTMEDVVRVARGNAPVTIGDDALAAMAASRTRIEALADDPVPVYGISTGFGALATRHIPL
ncbi:MAG: histidine ammonia-lyase, partial [Mycobacterium sp.]|nr:histidine ammonia-lyase [Mycobacterium sp.]